MFLRRLIKAVGGSEKLAQYGYVLITFNLDTGNWKKEFVNLKQTKIRSGGNAYEIVEDGNLIEIDDEKADEYLNQWDQIRQAPRDSRSAIAAVIEQFSGPDAEKHLDQLAINHKLAKLGVER